MMYPLVARNLTQIFRLMDGDYTVADIRQARQQQGSATPPSAWNNAPPTNTANAPFTSVGSGTGPGNVAGSPPQTAPQPPGPSPQPGLFPKPGMPGYSEPEHIGRYVDYGRQYGYEAMIQHLKEHEGDADFMAKVKNAWNIWLSQSMFQAEPTP